MFYIEIIDNEITRYTENKNVVDKFYANYIESEIEPKRGFDGKLYLKEIPKEVLAAEEKYKITCDIVKFENEITPRRMREAMLGNKDSIAFIEDIEKQIKKLREVI